jgi:hypothetical protein
MWGTLMVRKLAVVVLSATALTACLGQADTRQVDDATNQVFSQIQAKQYDAIYDNAAPEFQGAESKAIWDGFMQRIDRKLGACQTPKKTMNWRSNATTNGFFVAQGYSAACANGQLQLTVTTVLRGGQVKLVGYNANSPLLLTD